MPKIDPKLFKLLKRFFTPAPILNNRIKKVTKYYKNKEDNLLQQTLNLLKKIVSLYDEIDKLKSEARTKEQLIYEDAAKLREILDNWEASNKWSGGAIDTYNENRSMAALKNALNGKFNYFPRHLWSTRFGLTRGLVPQTDNYLEIPTAFNEEARLFWKDIHRDPFALLPTIPLTGPDNSIFMTTELHPEDELSTKLFDYNNRKTYSLPIIHSEKRAKDFLEYLKKSGFGEVSYAKRDKEYLPATVETRKQGPIIGTNTGLVRVPDPINNTIEEGTIEYFPKGTMLDEYTTYYDPELGPLETKLTSSMGVGDGKLNIPNNYIKALSNLQLYIFNLSGGTTYDYGSAVGVTKLGLPHTTHDADVFIIDSDFNRLVQEGKIPNPTMYRLGRTYKSDLFGGKYNNAELFGYDKNGNPNNPGMVDFNIIETDPNTGHAVGFNASEILRQFYPELYLEALNLWFRNGQPLTTNGFKDIKTNMTPLQLMSRYSPELKTLLDLLEIDVLAPNKDKLLGRDYNYFAVAPTDVLDKAVRMHAKAFLGDNVQLPPDLTKHFLDYGRNLQILDSLGIEGLDKAQIAKDPKRMLAIFNLNYLRRSVISRGTDLKPYFLKNMFNGDLQAIDEYASLFANGLNPSIDNAIKFLTRWNDGFFRTKDGKLIRIDNNGEWMNGTLNAVEMGDSRSFKDIYGHMQFGLDKFADTPELILQLLSYNTGNYPLTLDLVNIVLLIYLKYYGKNLNLQEGLELKDIVNQVPNQNENILNFYDELGKALNVPVIIAGSYDHATRFAFPLIKDFNPKAIKYGYGDTSLEYKQDGYLRDPIPNSISLRNALIREDHKDHNYDNSVSGLNNQYGIDKHVKFSNTGRHINNSNVDFLDLHKGVTWDMLNKFFNRKRKALNAKTNKAIDEISKKFDEDASKVTEQQQAIRSNINNLKQLAQQANRNKNKWKYKSEKKESDYKLRLVAGGISATILGLLSSLNWNPRLDLKERLQRRVAWKANPYNKIQLKVE